MIRGYASIIVLLAHAVGFYIVPRFGIESVVSVTNQVAGSFAVIAFFILSGYVIGLSLKHHVLQDSLTLFMVNRIARIFPPLLFSLLLVIFVYAAVIIFKLHGYASFSLSGDLYVTSKVSLGVENLISSALLIQNVFPNILFCNSGCENLAAQVRINGPLWSLGFEFWFYVVVYIAALALTRKRMYILLFFPLVISIYNYENYRFLYLFLIWISAFIFSWVPFKKLYALIIFGSVFGTKLYMSGNLLFLKPSSDYVFYMHQAIFLSLVYLIFSGLLGNKYISQVGLYFSRFSYTLYVVHFPILLLSFSLLHEFIHDKNIYSAFSLMLVISFLVIVFSDSIAKTLENKSLYSNWLLMKFTKFKKAPLVSNQV